LPRLAPGVIARVRNFLMMPSTVWIVSIVSTVFLILVWHNLLQFNQKPLVTGIVVGFLTAYHTHAVNQTRAFFDGFFKFNARYDKINDLLDNLPVITETKPDKDSQRAIADYLNLCAEEHLFCCRSYIPKVVIKAWNRGIMERFENPWISAEWEEERKKANYYGFENT